jgi:hypothetical protein
MSCESLFDMQSCGKDVIQFVLQCYFETTIVQIFKLMEISIVMVLGNVEDEWCFSTIFL